MPPPPSPRDVVPAPHVRTDGPGFINGRLEEAVGLHGEEPGVLVALQRALPPAPLAAVGSDFVTRVIRGYAKERPRAEATVHQMQRILDWRAHSGMDEARAPLRAPAPAGREGLRGGARRGAPRGLGPRPPPPDVRLARAQLLFRTLPQEATFHRGWPSTLAGEDCFGHVVFVDRIQARRPPPCLPSLAHTHPAAWRARLTCAPPARRTSTWTC